MINKVFIHLEAMEREVYYESSTGKVEFYYEEGTCWDLPTCDTLFFDTQKEAEAARDRIKHEMMEMLPTLRNYLEMFAFAEPDEDPDSFFRFDKDHDIFRYDNNGTHYYEDLYDRLNNRLHLNAKIADMLAQLYHSGTITINNETFNKDDVTMVKWSKNTAEIVLKYFKTIKVDSQPEFEFLKKVFG